jgi:hypothetical protein
MLPLSCSSPSNYSKNIFHNFEITIKKYFRKGDKKGVGGHELGDERVWNPNYGWPSQSPQFPSHPIPIHPYPFYNPKEWCVTNRT